MNYRARKLYTVTDLGGGDGGKGGVVHKLCDVRKAHTVLKVGGAQGSHGVRTTRGESFNFSQFGCGTFNGACTHLTQNFVADPNGILNEGNLLRYSHGVHDAFELLTIDEETLCITPYHGIASRLRELARKDRPKGTVGVGVGEAFYDAERFPARAIRARDLSSSGLRSALEEVREAKIAELESVIAEGFWDSDKEAADYEIMLLNDPGLLDWTLDRFEQMRKLVRVVGREHLIDHILPQDGTIVVESSHGILTDRYQGFHPHVSKLRTLPTFTHQMLSDAGYDGEVINFGITRGFQIRHGAGPMVTETPELLDKLLPGSSKDENRYQGRVRVGPLDLVALRYAIAACGGPTAFDALAITWFDQVKAFGSWQLCDRYQGADDPTYFSPSGEIRVRVGNDAAQIAHQEQLGKRLDACRPLIESLEIPQSQEKAARLCQKRLLDGLGVPVRMISFGSTEQDKLCL